VLTFCMREASLYNPNVCFSAKSQGKLGLHMAYEKRKLPRFHITPCQFLDGELGKTFAVQDISMGGLALRLVDREDLPFFAVASIHSGVVKVEGQKLSAQIRIKHIRGTLIGAEWVEPSQPLVEHLDSISHPEKLGVNLRKYDFSDLSATQWFHNPVGVDLLFYQGDVSGEASGLGSVDESARPGRWMLYIHQNFVQWENGGGVQTGKAVAEAEEGHAHGIVRIETRLIEYDSRIDLSLIKAAKELVEHAPIESVDLKHWVLSHLNGAV